MSEKTLSNQRKNDLATLGKMSIRKFKFGEDEKQQAALEILQGKSLKIALIHANFGIRRANKSCAFESLDFEENDRPVRHETVAAAEPDGIEFWRIEIFDEATEQILDFIRDGGASVGRAMRVCGRMGQLRVANFQRQIVAEKQVKKGGKGQFGFDFGGSV